MPTPRRNPRACRCEARGCRWSRRCSCGSRWRPGSRRPTTPRRWGARRVHCCRLGVGRARIAPRSARRGRDTRPTGMPAGGAASSRPTTPVQPSPMAPGLLGSWRRSTSSLTRRARARGLKPAPEERSLQGRRSKAPVRWLPQTASYAPNRRDQRRRTVATTSFQCWPPWLRDRNDGRPGGAPPALPLQEWPREGGHNWEASARMSPCPRSRALTQ